MIIKLRFNHRHKGTDLLWCLIIDGVEYLCASVQINCMCWTSQDAFPTGEVKFHLTCTATEIVWSDDKKFAEIF